jgi:heme/copper-type cytochrome/quinol oxidase subunit 2
LKELELAISAEMNQVFDGQKVGALCVKRKPLASNKQDTVVVAVNTVIIVVVVVVVIIIIIITIRAVRFSSTAYISSFCRFTTDL